MLHKISTTASNAGRYLRREGPTQFSKRLLQEIPFRLKRVKPFFKYELMGRYVELRGNAWTLDGLRFSLDDPALVTSLKSRFFWGTYEDRERKLVKKHVIPDLPVIEGGGSIGVISCVTNKLLKDPTKHLVVEANPQLLHVLAHNRDQNGCKFEIVHAALDPHGPTVTFHIHKKFVGGSVQRVTGQPITVDAVTVGGLLRKMNWEKISLVLDIEGAEIDLIHKEADALKNHVAVIIVEMHPMISGAEEIAGALKKLEELGFTYQDRALDVYTYYNTRLVS
jgi:FkbM family methyltransferase